MGGTQDEFFEVNLLQNPRVLRNLVEHPDASIDHRISGDVNSAKNILLYKNFAVAVRWSEENVRQMIRYSPILLFGHVWIVATGPGGTCRLRRLCSSRSHVSFAPGGLDLRRPLIMSCWRCSKLILYTLE